MNKTKVLLAAGTCGFVLSLLIGLISRVSFGVVFLRAVLFALVFAGIAALGQFIFERFLNNTVSVNAEGSNTSGSEQASKGQFVDIKVEDAVFPNEENAPLFQIPKELKPDWSNNGQSKTSAGVPKKTDSAVSSQGEGDAEPLFSIPSGIQQTDEPLFTPVQNNPEPTSGGDGELGMLPDMGSMLSDMQNSSNDDIIVTSDFANSGDTVRSGAMQAADTEIIAKAIHTVLSRDNS